MSDPDPQPWLAAEPPAACDLILDERGLLCPLPIVHLGKALREAAPATVFEVIATDPGFFPDLLRWIRVRPVTLLALRAGEGEFRAWLRKPEAA